MKLKLMGRNMSIWNKQSITLPQLFSLFTARCSLLIVHCSLFIVHCSLSQPASPLDRVVSVEVRNERVSEVLRQLSQQADFTFSYNPAVVNDTRTVSVRAVRQPVRIVLGQVFEGQAVNWKVRGNHVLLLGEGEAHKAPTHFFLDGYVTDQTTGQRIAAVSIYERTSLASTVSNPYGYYRLKLARDLPTNARVEVRKRLYVAESVSVASRQSRTVDVRLRPVPVPALPATASAVAFTTVAVAQKPPLPKPSADTIRPAELPKTNSVDTTRRVESATVSQDTIQPRLHSSTTSVATVVDSSAAPKPTVWEQTRDALNETYQAARQLIHRQNLDADTLYRPFQLSLFPYVGTNHRLSNHVINHFSVNVVAGTALGLTGLEVGGFSNNIRADVRGIQLAGFANFVGRDLRGIQAAGFSNRVRGDAINAIQAAGFSNRTLGNATRFIQLAGFSNRTRNLTYGIQAAGFINHARTVRNGLQIAPFNFADSSNSIPIGLWSVVRKNGYRRFEVAANETFPLNVTFRSGVRLFYNLVSVGLLPSDGIGNQVWQAGYGVGTGVRLGRTWAFTVEGSGHVVWNNAMNEVTVSTGPSILLRGTPTLEKRFGRLAIGVGPSLVFFSNNLSYNALANTKLLIRDRPTVGSLPFTPDGWAGWVGWQVGLRLTN